MKLALERGSIHKKLEIITDKSSSYVKHVNKGKYIENKRK